jgi:hypothetical protein
MRRGITLESGYDGSIREGEPHYYDIDASEYLARIKEKLEAKPCSAPPHTAKFLESLQT